jgi:hypothetical protein
MTSQALPAKRSLPTATIEVSRASGWYVFWTLLPKETRELYHRVYTQLETYRDYEARRGTASASIGIIALAFCAVMTMPGRPFAIGVWWIAMGIMILAPLAASGLTWLIVGIPGRESAMMARAGLEHIIAGDEETDEHEALLNIFYHDDTYKKLIMSICRDADAQLPGE